MWCVHENDPTTTEAVKLFAGDCDFIRGVQELSHLLPDGMPEIAFVGRSNVGKSSLINALTGRKALARTSHTPGRTQQLNFFDLGSRMYVVDLPGYGFAKVSKTMKRSWNKLIRDYLKGRASLRCVFILIDARHGLKESDQEFMTMLDESGVHYRLILTKTDKTKNEPLMKMKSAIETELKKHPAAFPHIYSTSSVKMGGLDDVKTACLQCAV